MHPPLHDDPLSRLLLRVAQRADELARIAPSGGSARRDRETWTRAEQDFFPLVPQPAPRLRRTASRVLVGS